MATVFIGGSRAFSRLNTTIREQLDDLIAHRCTIFVGDANGADKAVQQHFAERGYGHVIVYCMDNCRNNLGNWPRNHVSKPGTRQNFAYYAAKDLAMARDAKCGVMLWDGESKGTLNNIQELMSAGKTTLVYFAPEKTFHKLISGQQLEELLQRCDPVKIREANRQIRTKLPTAGQLPLEPRHP